MSRIQAINEDQATGQTAELYKGIKSNLGAIPQIFQSLGSTPKVLAEYLNMGAAVTSLTPVEKEAIALTVAQANSCGYCLGAHTAIATKLGVSAQEAIENRKGTSADSKTKALLQLTREIVTEKGYVSDRSFNEFVSAGYKPEQAAEVVFVVAQNIFTNYFNHLNQTTIDFPEVPKI